ncbi:MAG: hypothetical protein GDA50_06755 [Alphaproteobacteria bacterium GM202ARS2]|nr:hypothetical protein [Alphaproteobacteria bacterium GM202ARS2]
MAVSAFSAQDIYHLPSANVPVVIASDSSGRVHVRVRGLLGRFKVAFLRYLGRTPREAQSTHTQFRQFLEHHYGEGLTTVALQQAQAAWQGSRRELTSRQARQALDYVQRQRINHLKHNRAVAHHLIHEDSTTFKLSGNYQFFKQACSALDPPVDVGKMTSKQLRYARRSLVRYLQATSQHGKIRFNDDQLKEFATQMLARADALGEEHCQRIVQAQDDAHKAMTDLFDSRERGDNSTIVKQLMRASQTMTTLQQLETTADYDKPQAYLDGVYGQNALNESMTAHLEDVAVSSENALKFHATLSSFSRHDLAQTLGDALQRQSQAGTLSQDATTHLKRALAMTTHLQKQWGVYGTSHGSAPGTSGTSGISRADLETQMQVLGALTPQDQRKARVAVAHQALQQAQAALSTGQPLPSALAISKVGAGKHANRQSLDFMQKALQAALDSDESVRVLREGNRAYAKIRQQDPSSLNRQEAMKHKLSVDIHKQESDRLRTKILKGNSSYATLHREMTEFHQALQRQPTGAWKEKAAYQQGMAHLLKHYAPENLESLPLGSRLDWDDDGTPYLNHEQVSLPSDKGDALTKMEPIAVSKQWRVGKEGTGVTEEFASHILNGHVLMDDGNRAISMEQAMKERYGYDKRTHVSQLDVGRAQLNAATLFREFVGTNEQSLFLSHVLAQTFGEGGVRNQNVQFDEGVVDSSLTHAPLIVNSHSKMPSIVLKKNDDGSFVIKAQSTFTSDALLTSADAQSTATPLQDGSGWSLSYDLHVTPQDFNDKTFSTTPPHRTVTLKV